jgi:small subunit ribosomal protein S3
MVIGKGGSEVEALRKELNNLTGKRVHINIIEIKKPDLDAKLVGESIARQLEGRVAFRRAMRGAMQRTMRSGAKGIKTQVAGRLNGADMSRVEAYSDGTVPLHTLRADIDYSWVEARTTYGKLGVKTWIYRGEILPEKKSAKGGN